MLQEYQSFTSLKKKLSGLREARGSQLHFLKTFPFLPFPFPSSLGSYRSRRIILSFMFPVQLRRFLWREQQKSLSWKHKIDGRVFAWHFVSVYSLSLARDSSTCCVLLLFAAVERKGALHNQVQWPHDAVSVWPLTIAVLTTRHSRRNLAAMERLTKGRVATCRIPRMLTVKTQN